MYSFLSVFICLIVAENMLYELYEIFWSHKRTKFFNAKCLFLYFFFNENWQLFPQI